MSKLIRKSVRIYKDQGTKEVALKTANFINLKTKNAAYRVLPNNLKKRIDIKDEEYGFVSNSIFQIDSNDIKASIKATSGDKPKNIKTANWFVPYFNHLAFGGIYTIFRFMSYFDTQGLSNRVIIYDHSP